MRLLRVLGLAALSLPCPAAAAATVPLPELLHPSQIYVSDDRLVVVDGCSILVYGIEDLNLIRKFGKEGEGPREFKEAVHSVYFIADRLVVNSTGKLTFFKRNGEFISEKKAPGGARTGDYCPIGDGYAAVQFSSENRTFYLTVNLYNGALNKVREIIRIEDDFQPGKSMRAYPEPRTFDVFDDRLYVSFDDNFIIRVFDARGRALFTIGVGYERLKLEPKHREAADRYFRTDPYYKRYYDRIRKMLTFPSHLPAIRTFTFSEDRLYVETRRKRGNKTEFYVFTPRGKFLDVRHLPLVEGEDPPYGVSRLYRIRNGRLYQLVEDEAQEVWRLHSTEIE